MILSKTTVRVRPTPVTLSVLALAALMIWVSWRIGAFSLLVNVTLDGRSVQIPDTFSSVDHPFHATRAFTLLESLKHGHMLRWVGNHQGGYPVEFYPLGVAWLEVGIWAALFGSLPILAVHKLAVILIFLLPMLGFWLLARADRISPGVAVLATAMHVAIPGGKDYVSWTTGGYTELVQWGLVTNVAGATCAMIATAMLILFVSEGRRWVAAGAIIFAACSAYANPRSLFAVAIAAVAILIASLVRDEGVRRSIRLTLGRIAFVGVGALLLAMPIIAPLVRYNDAYYFVRYQAYENLDAYWTASLHAVSPVMLYACLVGVVVALLMPRVIAARAVAITLVGYVVFTGWLSVSSTGVDLIQQLETPRLMPYQRLLMIYLAAFAIWWVVAHVTNVFAQASQSDLIQWAGCILVAGAVLVIFVMPFSGVPEIYHGLTPTATTGDPEFAEYQQAVDEADAIRPDDTAILVVGTIPTLWNWHAPLYGPTETDAPFFYNDWLWYWNDQHAGTPGYSFLAGNSYPDPAQTFDASYLQEHGIGVVLVTNVPSRDPNLDPKIVAQRTPTLSFDRTVGIWDVYRVQSPTAILTNGGVAPTASKIGNERIEATFANGSGDITIRRNWFPRWSATVNGESVPITHTDDGYMQITAPAGDATVVLTYDVTIQDWLARSCAVIGAVLLIALVFGKKLRGRDPVRWLVTSPVS